MVPGGYDAECILDPNTNHIQALGYSNGGYWMNMENALDDIRLSFRNGSNASVFSPPTNQLFICPVRSGR